MEQAKEKELCVKQVQPGDLYNLLSCSRWGLLLIDWREEQHYREKHVKFCVNIPHTKEEHERQKLFEEKHTEKWVQSVILIGQDDNEAFHQRLLGVIATSSATVKEVKLLNGGFTSFHDQFPFLCFSTAEEEQRLENSIDSWHCNSWPSMIIDDFLFLGDWEDANHKHALETLSIHKIVNCTPDQNIFEKEDGFEYLQVPIDDSFAENIQSYFEKASEFIEQAKEKREKVLVHCHAGISRSPTIVMAYLMKTQKWTLQETIDYVKSRRHIISPNGGFMKQLSDYEETLYGKRTYQHKFTSWFLS